jgi:predicted nucleic acid-binding protein
MSAKPFLDTNILIYAFAPGAKAAAAERILADGALLSVQVLNEFVNVSRRKLDLSWRDIEDRLDVILALVGAPLPITIERHTEARAIASRRQLAFYDALIVASAIASGARELLSEDMQHGAKFSSVRVRNPFAT